MKSKSRVENQREWQRRVAGLKRFQGSAAEYCRERGLSPEALAYWRRKLGGRARSEIPAPSPGPIRGRSRPQIGSKSAPPAFIPVELITHGRKGGSAGTGTTGASLPLPDPRWVAELIRHLGEVRP